MIKIVVLQRGWVAVGTWSKAGSECTLDNAAIIRAWGTTKGLGELAMSGPTNKTVLDKCTTLRYHELSAVLTMDSTEEKWAVLFRA